MKYYNGAIFFFFLLHTLTVICRGTEQFDYYDNDLARVCRPIERQLDVLFILDGSGSVSGSTFDTQIDMLNRIIQMVEIGPNRTQIAVMQYASFTRLEFAFAVNKDKDQLLKSVAGVHHMSGTTKTGKALDKALHLFADKSSGARMHPDVAQVAVVVSDGHSHDDPVPASIRLRDAGILLLTLGIGFHVNRNELIQMTGDENLAFQDVQRPETLEKFTQEFKNIAKGEHCDYARGPSGAAVNCGKDYMSIGVSTKKHFKGHLYVEGHFIQPNCQTKTEGTDLELRIALDECGLRSKFVKDPPGVLFEAKVVLKFHPQFSTKKDRDFDVKCFYADKANKVKKRLETVNIGHDKRQIVDASSYCEYSISRRGSECPSSLVHIGEDVEHRWNCNSELFDTYQAMLVHSCYAVNTEGLETQLVIDENGCTLDPTVISTPNYTQNLAAVAVGQSVRFADRSHLQIRCSIRLCDKLLGECDEMLPPKCGVRSKRSSDNLYESSVEADPESLPIETEDSTTMKVPAFVTYREALRKQLITPTPSVEKLKILEHARPLEILSPVPRASPDPSPQPTTSRPPPGSVEVKLSAQKVAIVRSDNFKHKFQEALRKRAGEIVATVPPTGQAQVISEADFQDSSSNIVLPADNTETSNVVLDKTVNTASGRVAVLVKELPQEAEPAVPAPLHEPQAPPVFSASSRKSTVLVKSNRRGQLVGGTVRELFPRLDATTENILQDLLEPELNVESLLHDLESAPEELSDEMQHLVFTNEILVESQILTIQVPGSTHQRTCRAL